MLSRLNLGYTLLLSSLVAFCSMGYELLIARFLSAISSDAVISQSVTVGTFLLSLGIGAYLYGRKTDRDPWKALINIEIAVALIACVALPALALVSLYVRQPLVFVFASQIITVVIGVLSGAELPALIDAARPHSKRAFGWVLASNYVGSLIASITLPSYFIPNFGIYTTGWMFALFTALAASMAFMRNFKFNLSLRYPLIAVIMFLPPYLTTHQEVFEQFYLKSYYFLAPTSLMPKQIRETLVVHGTIPDVIRYSTPYQEIDIVADDYAVFGGENTNGFHLFIDQRNQFGSDTERIYHDTMIHGSINLAKKIPETVLIVGGGDGLLVRELLKYNEVKSITLVELDPKMIDLANNYKPLANINGRSLQDPRVHVEVADGFSWLRKTKQTFDGIIIDLPHPVSVDLSRLYSVEFYKFVRARLSETGFMVFDFPFDGLLKTAGGKPENLRTISAILSAVTHAGFTSYRGFGTWESFLIATPAKRDLNFDYPALDPTIANISAFNMSEIKLPEVGSVSPNSIFKPVVLKTRLDGGG